jgi:hypothetical protein
MENILERVSCYRCGIELPRPSAIKVHKTYPGGRKEVVHVCYSCFRQIQSAGNMLVKLGSGRYCSLNVSPELENL